MGMLQGIVGGGGLGSGGAPAGPNGTQLVAGDFSNLDPAWTQIEARPVFQVVGGVAEPTILDTSCAALWNGVFDVDQWIEVTTAPTFDTTLSYLTFFLRNGNLLTGPGNAIIVRQSTAYFYRSDNWALLGQVDFSALVTLTTGDVIRADAVGSNLTLTVNGVVVASYKEASQDAAGLPGIQLFADAGTNTNKCAVTAFRAGNAFPTSKNGIWEKRKIAIRPTIADCAGLGLPGTHNQTMLYEGGSQLGLGPGNVFKMWFGGSADIYYAESTDGLTWTRKADPVILGKSLPRIFKSGGVYYLYVGAAATDWTSVDQYTSADGVTWVLANGTVIAVGGAGEWDHTFCGYFQVVEIVGGEWRAIYDGSDGVGIGAGYATSPDGIVWTKHVGNPVIPVAANMAGGWDIHKIGGTYYGWANTKPQSNVELSQIARMESADLLTWVNLQYSVLPDNSFEGVGFATGEVAIPSLVEVGGNTFLFYSATPDDGVFTTAFQIAVASTPYTLAQIVAGPEL